MPVARVRVPLLVCRLVVAAACAVAGGASLIGEQAGTPPDSAAAAASRDQIAGLTVAIERGAAGGCSTTGVIVGHDPKMVYVATFKRPDVDDAVPAHVAIGTAAGAATRVPARLLHSDETDLRVYGIEDPTLAAGLARAAWDVLGDAAGVEAREPVFVTACQGSSIQHARSRPVVIAQKGDIAFHGTGLESSTTGGPLVHLVGPQAMLVGLLVSVRERADAKSIDAIMQTLREWKVPVALHRRGTRPGCSYDVRFSKDAPKMRGRQVLMLGSNADSLTATVQTAADCPWTAHGSGVNWLGVTGGQTGPGSATIRATRGNMCDGRFREGSVYVAGRLYRIGQDGTALGMGC